MRLSEHFVEREFRCRCCGRVRIVPELVQALEQLRAQIEKPITIVSGYRCPTHNRAVGGGSMSSHVTGRAADVRPGLATPAQASGAGFRGIGIRNGWAVHLDVRQGRAARWTYI